MSAPKSMDYNGHHEPSSVNNSQGDRTRLVGVKSSTGLGDGFGSRHSPVLSPPPFKEAFPCHSPTNPSYRNLSTRLQSFANWPGIIRATPQELAEAGFFYLGERDRCKCFYCNGGLQHWDVNDQPFEEHAKYFPQCEFVLQQKGPEFVAAINAENPNLQRPGDPAAAGTSQQHQNNQTEQSYDIAPVFIPPQETERSESNENEIIEGAKMFGYSDNLINLVIDNKRRSSNSSYESLSDIIEDLIQAEERNRNNDFTEQMDLDLSPMSLNIKHQHRPCGIACDVPLNQTKNVKSDSNNLRKTLENVLDESICKICLSNERSCVFTSCGHLCSCYECGKSASNCPICNAKVTQTLKIFRN